MNVTKELLEHLQVTSFSVAHGGRDILAQLVRIEARSWTFALSEPIASEADAELQFRIHFAAALEQEAAFTARLSGCGGDWCTVIISEKTESALLKNFIGTLLAMEIRYERFGRRKEARLKIGSGNARLFGLTGAEQTLFLPASRIQQPCVVLDASVHGIAVITPFSSGAIRNTDTLLIKVAFANPAESIILQAHKVSMRLNRVDGGKTYATISCQLLEPVHFAWKERVIALLEKEERPA